MTRIAATVLVATGSFGCDVASKLKKRVRTRTSERPPDLAVIELPDAGASADDETLARCRTKLIEEIQSQLALDTLVTLPPGESSLPWLDVFIVGDMTEPMLDRLLEPIIDTVAEVARDKFSSLLGRAGARVVAMPLLTLGAEDTATPGGMRAAMDRLAAERPLRLRPFFFARQTARYLLSRDQLVSTIVGVIEQLVLAGFREHVELAPFLRGDPPRAGASTAPAPFATAGIASVHVDGILVRAACRNRATLGLVGGMRAGPELGLAEREKLARVLRLDWGEVLVQLGLVAQSDAASERLEKIIRDEAPNLACPTIEARDSPEDVRRRKLGEAWVDETTGTVDAFVARFEQRKMAELAERVDSAGQRIARTRRERVARAVDEWVWSGPRGWAAARSTLGLLRDEMARTEDEVAADIAATTLPVRPDLRRVRGAITDLHAETERRPRRFRAWSSGLLFWVIGTVFGYSALWLLEQVLQVLRAPDWLIAGTRPPLSVLIAALAAGIVVPFGFRSMLRSRHAELCEVRDEVARRLERFMTGPRDSLLAYYLSRLELMKQLWRLRLARAERKLYEQELARLDELQRALDTIWNRAMAEQRRLDSAVVPHEGSRAEARTDLLLRDVADPQLVDVVFQEAVPDEKFLLETFFSRLSTRGGEWRYTLPMASPESIERFLDEALDLPTSAELLGRIHDRPDLDASRALTQILADLSTRLAPALGLTESAVDSHYTWVICSPRSASAMVNEALKSLREEHATDALGADWTHLDSPRDDGSVYLAVYVTHLRPAALEAYPP